jgi:hypothetical protein
VVVPTANPIEGKPGFALGELVVIAGKTESGYRGIRHPQLQEVDVSEREIARFIRENEGIYFSYAGDVGG